MLKNVVDNDPRKAGYEKQYGSGLRIAAETLSRQQIDYLVSLPHPLVLEVSSRRILLCHGTPWDNNEYLYPDAPAAKLQRCTAGGHDLVVVGHSHYSMVHQIGGTQLVNPGSVGQPRDRKPGAAWATYDTATGEVALKREQYDASSLVAEAGRRHPEIPYLARILVRT
jgi:predicted phosphodiesterase